jgi:hypothetical protein
MQGRPEDILIRVEIFNRSREQAQITVLPTSVQEYLAFGKIKTKPDAGSSGRRKHCP